MLENYSGATRIVPIIGHPIAQVKAPLRVTRIFEARGVDAICIPVHVQPRNLRNFMEAFRSIENADGLIITVPHKLAVYEYCDEVTELARCLESINVIKRMEDGRLIGGMFDGIAMVSACRDNGCAFEGRRALLIGAGGAGTAIAHAIAAAGVSELVVTDVDGERSQRVTARLAADGHPVRVAQDDASTFDIIVNATPLGMRDVDPLPVPSGTLARGMFVGDVVTMPLVSPLIVAARAVGCKTSTGTDMSNKVCELIVDFLADGIEGGQALHDRHDSRDAVSKTQTVAG